MGADRLGAGKITGQLGIAAEIGSMVVTEQVDAIPKYADYFGTISAAILLFVAVVAISIPATLMIGSSRR